VAGDERLELLINNAGFGVECRFHEEEIERQLEMIRLNVEALVRLTHAALRPMVERGHGAIINVSSGAGFAPAPFFAVYAATKAFVTSFTQAVHEEVASRGVRLQVLCPGFTRTEFQQVAGVDSSRFPGFMWQTPEEVARASLEALRKGRLVCIPGYVNQALLAVRGPIGQVLTRKIFAWTGEQARRKQSGQQG
ncbi:MAG: SDR family NAD(P)-dependent oxidoreductase, partial [Candidatus Dadabacteria bacterium]